eukprot:tig00000144_g9086.t1
MDGEGEVTAAAETVEESKPGSASELAPAAAEPGEFVEDEAGAVFVEKTLRKFKMQLNEFLGEEEASQPSRPPSEPVAQPEEEDDNTPKEHAIKCSDCYTWGSDSVGQLGHGHGRNMWEPTLLKTLRFADFEYASQPSYKISCGFHHAAAVSDVGMFTWGSGEYGQLGHGENTNVFTPKLVEALSNRRVRRVACGTNHTMCLTDSGQVFTWGRGKHGRLGHGDEKDAFLPQEIDMLRSKQIVQISAGGAHSAALTSLGDLYMWGNGQAGQLGLGEKHDQRTPGLLRALQGKMISVVSCGEHHTAACTDAGELFTWGFGVHGRLGHGDEQSLSAPKLVEGLKEKRVVLVSCGGYHTACLAYDAPDGAGSDPKEVFTWGANGYGQLGHGDSKDLLRPKRVKALSGRAVCQVVCGSWHTAATDVNGYLYAWGWGEEGQLGHNSEKNVPKPAVVKKLSRKRVVQFACGWSHMMAVCAERDAQQEEEAAARREEHKGKQRKKEGEEGSPDGLSPDEEAPAGPSDAEDRRPAPGPGPAAPAAAAKRKPAAPAPGRTGRAGARRRAGRRGGRRRGTRRARGRGRRPGGPSGRPPIPPTAARGRPGAGEARRLEVAAAGAGAAPGRGGAREVNPELEARALAEAGPGARGGEVGGVGAGAEPVLREKANDMMNLIHEKANNDMLARVFDLRERLEAMEHGGAEAEELRQARAELAQAEADLQDPAARTRFIENARQTVLREFASYLHNAAAAGPRPVPAAV